MECSTWPQIIDIKWREGLMAGEREEAGRDILYSIEEEVSAEVAKVVALRLEGKNAAAGAKLGCIKRIEADIGANVVEDIAIAQIFAQSLYCFGFLGGVSVRAIVFIWC
jgi:hypothetical protein